MMRESFYATAATVIPVFFLAHAVLRSVAADLLMARWRGRGRYVLQGKILLAAIAACVLVPMAGEVAALMALTGIPSPYMMGLTWLGLGWSTATFSAISIAELLKLCRDREEKNRQTAIPSISAEQSPLEGVPGAIPHVEEVRTASQADLPPQARLDRGPPHDRVRRARRQQVDRGSDRLDGQELREDRPPLSHHRDPGRTADHHRRRPLSGDLRQALEAITRSSRGAH